jgi:ABC-2 type transport system ATP-binding protein
MLNLHDVTHVYPNGTRALDHVTLSIPRGMYGLLGPNGAGKSTLMRAIATLQTPTEGTIHFGPSAGSGQAIDVIAEPEKLRRKLGYLPQDFGVYPRVSALEMLDHMAVLKGIASAADRRTTVETLLHQTNLWSVRKQMLSGFSGGMRQRFGIAQALIGNPELIIVDEPTAGLDPEERNRFLNLLAEIGQNVVVILSTHIVDDVSDLCARMAVLADGRVQLEGAPLELIQSRAAGSGGRRSIGASSSTIASSTSSSPRVSSPDGQWCTSSPTAIPATASPRSTPASKTSTSPRSCKRAARPETATMLTKIARFEFRYLLRNPLLWVTAAVIFAVTLVSISVDGFGLAEGGLLENSAYATLQKYVMFSVLFLFVATAFVANAVIRDDETGFGPIIRSTRITKLEYLIGRFLGAYAIAALCMLLVPLAILLGSLMPWTDPAHLGPNRLIDHLYGYFLFALPNLLITSAVLFALATITRSMMGTYLGVVGFLSGYFVLERAFSGRPQLVTTVAIAEPFGMRAIVDATRYWTAAERNVRLPDFTGALLYNRLLWIGISILCLALAYGVYHFADQGMTKRERKKQKLAQRSSAEAPVATSFTALPSPQHGNAAVRALLWMRTRFEVRQVVLSPAFVVLMAFGMFSTLATLIADRDPDGRPTYPTTLTMIPELVDIPRVRGVVIDDEIDTGVPAVLLRIAGRRDREGDKDRRLRYEARDAPAAARDVRDLPAGCDRRLARRGRNGDVRFCPALTQGRLRCRGKIFQLRPRQFLRQARLLPGEFRSLSVRPCADRRVSGLSELRPSLRRHHPVFGNVWVHLRLPGAGHDRPRHGHHRARAGAPGDRRGHGGLGHAVRNALPVFGADGGEEAPRRGSDPPLPAVRARPLSRGPRRCIGGRTAARPCRKPVLDHLSQRITRHVPAAEAIGRGRDQPSAQESAAPIQVQRRAVPPLG